MAVFCYDAFVTKLFYFLKDSFMKKNCFKHSLFRSVSAAIAAVLALANAARSNKRRGNIFFKESIMRSVFCSKKACFSRFKVQAVLSAVLILFSFQAFAQSTAPQAPSENALVIDSSDYIGKSSKGKIIIKLTNDSYDSGMIFNVSSYNDASSSWEEKGKASFQKKGDSVSVNVPKTQYYAIVPRYNGVYDYKVKKTTAEAANTTYLTVTISQISAPTRNTNEPSDSSSGANDFASALEKSSESGTTSVSTSTSSVPGKKWITNFGVGFSIPCFNADVSLDDYGDDEIGASGGFAFHLEDHIIYDPNGFCFLIKVGLGYVGADIEGFDDVGGFGMYAMFGLGKRFGNQQVAFIPTVGFGYNFAFYETDYYVYDVEISGGAFDFCIDLKAQIMCTKKVGISFSLLMQCALAGSGSIETSLGNYSAGYDYDIDAGSWSFVPAFCINFIR